MTYEPQKTTLLIRWFVVVISIITWAVVSFILVKPAVGANLSKDKLYGANSQNMRLLQSLLGAEIVGPMGGADELVIDNGALTPVLSTITDTAFKIENTCNPRNDSIEIYKVRSGDTLSNIADMFCVSTNTIKWANDLDGPIRPGQELTILPISGVMHDVEKGDTLAKIAKKYGGNVNAIIAYNNIGSDDTLSTEMSIIVPNGKKTTVSKSSGSKVVKSSSYSSAQGGYYIKPASGRITSPFGTRRDPITGRTRHHNGTDIASSMGTTIKAAASGKVIEARPSGWNGGYGKKVVIQHANGTKTLYAHLNSVNVKVGEYVNQGQKIGTMGGTGRVTGVHLHFEIIKGNKYLKPSF